ncbi:NAD(P)-binding domain-containing protein [Phenylobacterium sp.]|uniref:NAD(P)-dependent oxidoreductase n=1 Tax=Phenylobacterium sp. TaxID=1871053 RepID=UPI00286C9FA8|nr:NAD(P)-binding domain-containing protein [Phenylobacterium sp.]
MSRHAQATDVTVLGAGRMGSALVRAFRLAGRKVTVWNRDGAKAQALAPTGARPGDDLAAAVAASPVIVVCVSDYATSSDLVDAVAGVLGGRSVVQLTTGSPADAEAFSERVARAGAESLDGAVMAYPKQVGHTSCRILLSGDRALHDRLRPLLDALGRPTFMGDRAGAASAVDGALLFHAQATAFAYFQSTALLMAQGYDWQGLADLIGTSQVTADSLKSFEAAISARTHAGTEATLDVHFAAFQGIAAVADRSASRQPLMNAMEAHFERAVALGHGDDELSSVFETFRPPVAERADVALRLSVS